MNKFEQEVKDIVSISKVDMNLISTLHDNEMIAFAEWCCDRCYNRTTSGWYKGVDKYTTPELLTIFREERK